MKKHTINKFEITAWLLFVFVLGIIPFFIFCLLISNICGSSDTVAQSEIVQSSSATEFASANSSEFQSPFPTVEAYAPESNTPVPSTTQALAQATQPINQTSGEQFATVYDGAVLEYATISADGLQDIPSWLIVDACVDNGVEIFDICAPVEGYFETVDVPIYNPSQFTIRFSFDCDSGAFDGELIDYHMPEYLYAEFVLDGSTPDGRLYGCVDGTITVYYAGYDGDDYMEEYYFCPDITVQLQQTGSSR